MWTFELLQTSSSSSAGAETADQSCELSVRYTWTCLEKVLPPPTEHIKSFWKKAQASVKSLSEN